MYKVLALFLYFCGEIFIGMTITELQQLYAAHPNMAVMKRLLKDTSVQTIFCGGLYASAASLFSSILKHNTLDSEMFQEERDGEDE